MGEERAMRTLEEEKTALIRFEMPHNGSDTALRLTDKYIALGNIVLAVLRRAAGIAT